MALPTPLTGTQVNGAQDPNEIPTYFRTGPNNGMLLFVDAADPNLASSVQDGSVLVQFPVAGGGQPRPTLTSISPTSVAGGTTPDLLITGTGFSATDSVMILSAGADISLAGAITSVYVSPTRITGKPAFDPGDAGAHVIFVRTADGYDTAHLPLTITAS